MTFNIQRQRLEFKLGYSTAILPFFGEHASLAQTAVSAGKQGEWRSYASDKASSKYAPLDQVTAENFSNLKVAWTWQSVEADLDKKHNLKTWAWKTTPLMIDGVLYLTTSPSQAVALDAATGKTLWVYEPGTWKNGVPFI